MPPRAGPPARHRARVGRSAVRAIHAGRYQRADGVEVDWRDAVAAAVDAKISLPPDATLPIENGPPCTETRVQVENETTLQAAQALVAAGYRPLAVNFANGVSPGGGFLNGARAAGGGALPRRKASKPACGNGSARRR